MAIVLSDRVKETTITQGTGSITLGGALGGFVSFADGIGDNNETYYVIENDTNFEVGMGTYSSGSLSRDTVLASSNSGSKISLTGVSFVFCTLPADKALFKDGAGDVAVNHLTASGNVTVSGMLTMKRTNAGSFFHAYKEGTNPTIALYSDGASSPEWKLGIKDNPNSDTAAPTYAYVHGEDGNIGLYANSVNKLSLTHGGGLTLVNNGNTIFTSATTTGTSFIGQGAAYPTLILQAATSQSANIQEWRNSAGSVLSCVDNNGQVGIGTDDPDYKLDVAGNIGLNEYIYHNGDSNTYIRFRGDQIDFNAGGRNFLSLDEASQDECVINTGGNDIDFRVEGDNFTHLIFTDAATDRVGIGTSSPSYLLDVAGVGSFQTVRFSDGTTQTSAGLPVGSGSLIQKNALDIISVSGLTTAGIDALPHASGDHLLSEIQANSASGASSASNISTNSTTIIASGNANLALINSNTTNISTNASQIIASGNRNESQINNVSGYQVYLVNASGNSNRDLSNLNTVAINSSGNINKDYTASVSGWASASFGGTAISGYNSAYTDIKVAALVDSAPDTLNTLNELAAAINDDASISTTLTNLITANTTEIRTNSASGTTTNTSVTNLTTELRTESASGVNHANDIIRLAASGTATNTSVSNLTTELRTESASGVNHANDIIRLAASGTNHAADIIRNAASGTATNTSITNLTTELRTESASGVNHANDIARLAASGTNHAADIIRNAASGTATNTSVTNLTTELRTESASGVNHANDIIRLAASGTNHAADILANAASGVVISGIAEAGGSVTGGASGIAFFGDDGVLTSGDHFTYASANRGIILDGSTSSAITNCSGITMTTNGGNHEIFVDNNIQTIRSYNRTKIYVQTSEVFDSKSSAGGEIGNHVPHFDRGFTAYSFNPAYKAVVIKGKSAQSANLTEWQDSAGTVKTEISSQGDILTSGDITSASGQVFLPGGGGTSAPTLCFTGSSNKRVGFYEKISDQQISFTAGGRNRIILGDDRLQVNNAAYIGWSSSSVGEAEDGSDTNLKRYSAGIIAVHGSAVTDDRAKLGQILASGLTASGVELVNHVPASTANRLYNDGGTLKFNGSAVAAGGGGDGTDANIQANSASGVNHANDIIRNSASGTAVLAELRIESASGVNHAADIIRNSASGTNHAADIIRNAASGTAVLAELRIESASGVNHAADIIRLATSGTNHAADIIRNSASGTAVLAELRIESASGVNHAADIIRNAASGTAVLTELRIESASGTQAFAELRSGFAASGLNIKTNVGDSTTKFIQASGMSVSGIMISGGAPPVTHHMLYNEGGTLKWDGSAIGGGGASSINDLSDCLVENNSIFLGNDPSSTTNAAQHNTAVGVTALDSITQGDYNVAIGNLALDDLTVGHSNVAIGYKAGDGMTEDDYNVYIGYEVAESTASIAGNSNVKIGYKAGRLAHTDQGIFIGANAGNYIGDASSKETYVIGIGSSAMAGTSSNVLDNYGSVGLGASAGNRVGHGASAHYCLYLGFEAGYNAADASNMLYIANDEPSTTGAGGTIIKSDMEEKHLAIGQADLLVNAAGSGCLQIYAKDPADSSLFIEAPIGSEGDLMLAASGSHTLLQVDHRGTVHASGLSVSGVYLGDYVPTSTSNTLYNEGGTLKFNGSAVGGGGGDGSDANIQANSASGVNHANDIIRLAASGTNHAADIIRNSASGTAVLVELRAESASGVNHAADIIRLASSGTNHAADIIRLAASGTNHAADIIRNAASGTASNNLIISSGNAIRDIGESPIVDAPVQHGAELTVDWASGDFHNLELTTNVTRVQFLNANRVGQKIIVRVTQDSSARDFDSTAWNVVRASGHDGTKNEAATLRWAAGIQPVITTNVNHTDVYGFLCTHSNGKTFDGFIVGQDLPD